MIIRKAEEANRGAVFAIIANSPNELVQEPEDIPPLEDFLVAEVDGRIVGCCALAIYTHRLAEIRSLAVLDGYRGNGIATALEEACEKRAKELGIKRVLSITSNLKFFEDRGYRSFNEEKFAVFKNLNGHETSLKPP